MKRSVFVAIVGVVGACGSVSDNRHLDAAVHDDAPHVDSSLIDAPPPACDVTKPFGAPVQVGGVNTNAADLWAWMPEDQLTIYFTSAASGASDYNIYVGTRAQPTGNFTGVALLPGTLNTTMSEQRPILTSDGLTMFLESNATGGTDVAMATRSSTAADFGAYSAVSVINNANAADQNPWISGDGLTLYFASNRSGNFEVYKTTRTSATGNFAAPTVVGELTSTFADYTPVLSKDGLEIFFGTTRDSPVGAAAFNNIWHATRSTPTDGFGTPTAVSELNGASNDFPTWISPDRCQLMLSSDRPGNGSYDMWIATRPK